MGESMKRPLNTALKQYKAHMREQNRSKATIEGYASDLRSFLLWVILERNKNHWEDLNSEDPQVFIAELQAKGDRKASTINRRIAALSSFFQWAWAAGYLNTNLAEDLHTLPCETRELKYLTKEQQTALIKAIDQDVRLARLRYPKRWLARQRDASMVKLQLYTGLQLGEELNLKMSDFQMFDRKGAVIVHSSSPAKDRVIPLTSEARKAVLEWLAVRPETETDYVWIAVEYENLESPLSSRSVQRVVRRFGQEAGIESLSPQMLRHTFAKNLADSGASLEQIAALMGYTNLNAARVYTKPSMQDLEEVVEKLETERK